MSKLFMFKQAALLGKGKVGSKNSQGHIYGRGAHSVSDEHQKDPTFLHLQKHGLIEVFVPKKQAQLKEASSEIAKVSQEAARSQLEPDSEIGGDDAEADSSPRRNKKGK